MTFNELKIISRPHYYPISLDGWLPKTLRTVIRKIVALLALASFILSFDALPLSLGYADGLFFLFVLFYLSLSFTEFFYRSMLNEGLPTKTKENFFKKNISLDYALSKILFSTEEIDITRGFFNTKIGVEIFLRAGISYQSFKDFIFSGRTPTIASALNFGSDPVDLAVFAAAVYDADKSLQAFLSQNSVNKQEFVGSAAWVMNIESKRRRKERFWSRENLGAIPSIGTSWAYGVSADLGRFGIPFEETINISALDVENGYRETEVSLIENILEKREGANVIIIDDSETVARDIIGRFLKKIKLGTTQPTIEHKNIIELDWSSLVATYKDKTELEAEILKIFNQSITAGNIILFIRDLSGFVTNVKAAGINLPSLLSPYLSSSSLPIIASATNADFHFFFESTPTLLEKFERVIPPKSKAEASIPAILEQIPSLEGQYKVFFSYAGVFALAKAAERFVTYGEMPDKALDLLVEIAPWAAENKILILKENDVSEFISRKTGIETGAVKEEEARKIENLEKLIHKRVIGQDEAVNAIGSAIKRARSGVGNPNRPIASFLFIGPTGVGKTEVSKALAESYFGDENKMIRFDMSEYNGPDAPSRLIGDFALNKNGLLASRVRDNPYSVLLLDEFEKAAPDILDLFLQILDEGIFTDALGRQVNCRNLIIIATSNAGSNLIWQAVKSGSNLLKSKEAIVDSIIKEKTFRPELLNRFDGIILFHPLLKNELAAIAKLGLEKLARRLREQSFEFVINEDLINYLVEKGGDPQFGGRSINRAIQDQIEDLVARKIVSGLAKPGSKIEIKKEELA